MPRWEDKMGIAHPPITLFRSSPHKLVEESLGNFWFGFVNGNWIYTQTRYQKGIDWYCNKSKTREKISAKGHVRKGLFVTWEVTGYATNYKTTTKWVFIWGQIEKTVRFHVFGYKTNSYVVWLLDFISYFCRELSTTQFLFWGWAPWYILGKDVHLEWTHSPSLIFLTICEAF